MSELLLYRKQTPTHLELSGISPEHHLEDIRDAALKDIGIKLVKDHRIPVDEEWVVVDRDGNVLDRSALEALKKPSDPRSREYVQFEATVPVVDSEALKEPYENLREMIDEWESESGGFTRVSDHDKLRLIEKILEYYENV